MVKVHRRIGRVDIEQRAKELEDVLERVKEVALRPDSVKQAPRVNLTNTASILGLTKSQMLKRIVSGRLPGGDTSGPRTWYTLEQVQEMARAIGLRHPYAPTHGIVLTIANFKGGVAKSTTSVTLAQYLSVRGLKCLVIDMDPQASATTLFGYSPYLDVARDKSTFALLDGGDADPLAVVRATYWPGIDLVAANQFLYGREFGLAAAGRDLGGDVFAYFAEILPPLRSKYDVIIVDTQPSLGFLTTNAIWAADHLLVTVPPSSLDFASSVIFWSLLRDVMRSSENASGEPKYWDDISVMLTKVDANDKSTTFNKQLIAMGCGEWLLPEYVPATRVATNTSSEFQTLYDVERYEGSYKSLKLAREHFDRAYSQILDKLNHTWDVWQNPAQWQIERAPDSKDLFANKAITQDVVEAIAS
ncbi:MAG: AAA family ATPase [Sulfuricaulis sp.]